MSAKSPRNKIIAPIAVVCGIILAAASLPNNTAGENQILGQSIGAVSSVSANPPPDERPDEKKDFSILLDVPYVAQAPLGDWNDLRQKTGCEEASALMAMQWVKGESLGLQEAENEIIGISEYQLKNYGYFQDTSAQDTANRIFKGYFGYENVFVKYDIGLEDIKSELSRRNLVIAPVNGRKLNDQKYLRHMVVIVGYDGEARQFIVNDPAINNGSRLRFSENTVLNAIRDYPSGFLEPIKETRRAIIIVKQK